MKTNSKRYKLQPLRKRGYSKVMVDAASSSRPTRVMVALMNPLGDTKLNPAMRMAEMKRRFKKFVPYRSNRRGRGASRVNWYQIGT